MLSIALQLSSLAKNLIDKQATTAKKSEAAKAAPVAGTSLYGPAQVPVVAANGTVKHSLFGASTLQASSDPLITSLLLEAVIEEALAPYQEGTHHRESREGLFQQAYAALLADVQSNPSMNMAPYAERFAQLQLMEQSWSAFEALRESKPELFYMTKRNGELLPGNHPWVAEKSEGLQLDRCAELFKIALTSGNPTDVKVALETAQDLHGRLKLMLQLDGARELLKALSDTTVQTGEVPLLPLYIAPKGKDLAQLHMDEISQNIFELASELYIDDACETISKLAGQQACNTRISSDHDFGTVQYARAYSGGLATLNITLLNSTPAQQAFIDLLNSNRAEAMRVKEAFEYLRHHGESKLVTPSASKSELGIAKRHMATLQRFISRIKKSQAPYGVSQTVRTKLVEPALADMKRYDQIGFVLNSVEGSRQFADNPVQLAITLLDDLKDAEAHMEALADYQENDQFIYLVTRGWYGDPNKYPNDPKRFIYEFFLQNVTTVEIKPEKLAPAHATAYHNWSDDLDLRNSDEGRSPPVATASDCGYAYARRQLNQVINGEITGDKAVSILTSCLSYMREMRQKALVMDMAVHKIEGERNQNIEVGPTDIDIAPGHAAAIAWINATGNITSNIGKIAAGAPLKLASATNYKIELEQQVENFRDQLKKIRAELKDGGKGWNWGQGDYYISTASVDDLIKRLDNLANRITSVDSDDEAEMNKIHGEWKHLSSAPVVQFIYTEVENMHRMNGWRDLAYEGIITAPLALTGAFLVRGLASVALARTGLMGTRFGRFLLLGSEAFGLTLAGDATHSLIGHHGAPLTAAEKEGLSFIERLGMSMGMLKFFHSALRFSAPLSARASQRVALRSLMKQGYDRAYLFGTNEGRALLMRTMTRNIVSQGAGTAIRFGSSYVGFTAWDFIANTYQMTRMTGEFNPGAALKQTVSLESLRSRAIMVPMFAAYGQLLRPLATRSARKQMARLFAEKPELETQWKTHESNVVEAREQFEKLMSETEGGLRASKEQLEAVRNKLRAALEARQKFESELPDGIVSPQEKALADKTLEMTAQFEGSLQQINGILGKGNALGIVQFREGKFTFPAERSAEVVKALRESGADVHVHRNGVLTINKGLIRLVPTVQGKSEVTLPPSIRVGSHNFVIATEPIKSKQIHVTEAEARIDGEQIIIKLRNGVEKIVDSRLVTRSFRRAIQKAKTVFLIPYVAGGSGVDSMSARGAVEVRQGKDIVREAQRILEHEYGVSVPTKKLQRSYHREVAPQYKGGNGRRNTGRLDNYGEQVSTLVSLYVDGTGQRGAKSIADVVTTLVKRSQDTLDLAVPDTANQIFASHEKVLLTKKLTKLLRDHGVTDYDLLPNHVRLKFERRAIDRANNFISEYWADASGVLELNWTAEYDAMVSYHAGVQFVKHNGQTFVRAQKITINGRELTHGRLIKLQDGDTVKIGITYYAKLNESFQRITKAENDAKIITKTDTGLIVDNGDGNVTKVSTGMTISDAKGMRHLDLLGTEQQALALALDLVRDGKLPEGFVPRLGGRVAHDELIIQKMGGKTLDKMAPAERQLIPESAWKTFEANLHILHEAGLVHGDIHSGNIGWNPKNGNLWLIDFGLAKFKANPKRDVDSYHKMRRKMEKVDSSTAVTKAGLEPTQIEHWAKQFEQRFGEPPKEIWIVGSHADGSATPKSDIDIIFIHSRFSAGGTWQGADKGMGDGLALTMALNPQIPWAALHNPAKQAVAFPGYGNIGSDIPKAGFVDPFFAGARNFICTWSGEALPAVKLY